MDSITKHINKHKKKQFKFCKDSRYYKDEKSFIILRPLSATEYWLETSDGEGTGLAEGILYDVLTKLFKEVV